MNENNSSNDYNSIFDYNTQNEIFDSNNMNRDYLNSIYNEDMSFLNKDTRLTRTQYYQRKQELEESFDKEIKGYKKRLLLFSILFSLLGGFGLLSYHISQTYHSLYLDAYEKILSSTVAEGTVGDQQLANYIRFAIVIFATIAVFCIAAAIFLFLFLNTGIIKHILRLKKRKKIALEHLEEEKKECMLLGVYDAIK